MKISERITSGAGIEHIIAEADLDGRQACISCTGIGWLMNAEQTRWIRCETCKGTGLMTAPFSIGTGKTE